MLNKVIIKNFLSIKSEQLIKINKDITSIIGKNESGKSTILKAIYKLNGHKIEQSEKNVELKNESSYIRGQFIVEQEELKKINKNYEDTNNYGFYSLPDTYGNLYFEIEVTDKDGPYYSLYYLNEDKTFTQIGLKLFNDRIIDLIKQEIKKYKLTEPQLELFSNISDLDDAGIKQLIDNTLINSDLPSELIEELKDVSNQIVPKQWISLLPKYKFIGFSSFSSILKDKITVDELEKNTQAKNILKISNIDLTNLKNAFETNNEQELDDLQTQCVEVVSKKFKDIFQQTDTEFKIKVRFGSANKEIIFLTQDKTSGNKTINLSNRSEGFKWYLSLYLTLYDYLNKSEDNINYVLLLDEPNLYLHPGAQKNLLFNVFYEEFNDTQIIYTTHSPYMIDSNNSYSIRLVEKENETIIMNCSQDYVKKDKKLKSVDTITPLLTSLDLNFSNSLIINDNDILVAVEGIQDVYILKAMIKKTKMEDKFQNIKFIPCMSANKVPFLYSYLYGMGYNVYALFDNDKPGIDAIKEIINNDINDERINKLLKYNLANPSSKKFLLENLFSDEDINKYLNDKNTILYKRIYDNIESITFDDKTIKNFKSFLKELNKKLK